MLGKTNTIYKEMEDSTELTLHTEIILTDATRTVSKIEYVNNMFFVFLSGRVMYGKDITELEYLKNGDEYIEADYVIYHNEKYLFPCRKSADSTGGFKIYATTNFVDYKTTKISNTNDKGSNPLYITGIFVNSKGKIEIVLHGNVNQIWFGIFDTIEDVEMLGFKSYNWVSYSTSDSISIKMYNDYIFLRIGKGAQVLSQDYSNAVIEVMPDLFCGDIFYRASVKSIYYSINGIDWVLLGEAPVWTKHFARYENNTIGMFTEESSSYRFAFAETRQSILDSFTNIIDASSIIGQIQCSVNVGQYTYLGCTGGAVYKTWVDYSSNNLAPDVSVLKTLSAKQALAEAKKYTDQRFEELEAMIRELSDQKVEL